MQRPYPTSPRLTGITLAFRNPDYIADLVMPRVPVATTTFAWDEWDFAQGITLPTTIVGRKGRPTEVEFSAIRRAGFTEDHGLDDVVPNDDLRDIDAGSRLDPKGRATEGLTGLIALGREVRVAAKAQDTANYNHNTTVATGDQWDKADADPSGQILEAISTPLVRPNIAITSLAVLNKLRKNVSIVSAITGNTSGKGIVSTQQLADYFELSAILIGASYVNISKPGQAAEYRRIWGNTFALQRRAPVIATQGVVEPTWGFTAEFGERVAKEIEEPKTGLRGAVRIRVGESVGETVQSKEAGFLFKDVIPAT